VGVTNWLFFLYACMVRLRILKISYISNHLFSTAYVQRFRAAITRSGASWRLGAIW